MINLIFQLIFQLAILSFASFVIGNFLFRIFPYVRWKDVFLMTGICVAVRVTVGPVVTIVMWFLFPY